MKNYHKIAIAALLVLVIACTEKFDITLIPSTVVPSLKEYYLTVGQKEFSFPSTEFNASTTVNSSGVWNFVGQASWLNISPAQGSGGTSAVSLTAAANSITESRISIFELQSPQNDEGWYASHTITASQKATEAYIKVNNTTNETYTGAVTFDGKSNSMDFFVDSNCEWEVSFSDNWMDISSPVTVSDIRERITLSVSENATNQQREGTVTLSYTYDWETVATEIRVYQKPASITASADVLSYTYVGGTGVISFNSEASWTAYTNDSFIELVADNSTTFDQDKGSSITGIAGSGTFGINVAKNSSQYGRNGAVYITVNGKDIIELPIEQGNVTLTVSESYHNLTYTSSLKESKIIYVKSNAPYNVKNDDDWITSIDNKDGSIEIIAADNPTKSSRSTTLYVESAEDATLYQKIDVSQNGKTFELYSPSNQNLNFGRGSGTQNIMIYTNAKWSATSNSEWIKLESTSGTPQTLEYVTIPVNVSDNQATEYRSGRVEISMGENTSPITVDVYQDPIDVDLYDTYLSFGSKQDTTAAYFYSNAPWTATTDEDWISISPANGTPAGTGMEQFKIDVSVESNVSSNTRTGKIKLDMYGNSKEITVEQSGVYMSISTDSISLNHYASSKIVTISSNGLWNATADSDWITTSADGDNLTISVADNKTAGARDGKVTVSMYDGTWIIKVHQQASTISLNRESISFPHNGGNISFFFYTDSKWTIETDPPQGWLSVDKTSGGEDYSYTERYDITANATHNNENKERICKIIISTKNQVTVLTAKQEQKYLEIESPALNFTADSSVKCYISVIKATDEYKAYADQDWVRVYEDYNYNTGKYEICVKPGFNYSRYERTAIVTIENDYNLSHKLKLTQQGRTISAAEAGAEFLAKGGTASTYVTVDGDFEVSTPSGSWITAKREWGTNKITLTAAENETGKERTEYVTVSLANQPEGEEVFSEKFAVKQYPYTNKINLEGFEGADKDVTVVKGKGFSINITTYTSDKDYNKQNGGVNTTVNGYGDDKGKDKNGNGNITINGYGDDKNYNN